MLIQKENDTIAAISTAQGNGAIGIIRLSGPESLQILSKVWMGRVVPSEFEPCKVYTGHIKKSNDSSLLDQVVVFYRKAPDSYTGEDLVEVQGHGGRKILELLLTEFIAAGARMAEPGEFTKRAFLNGKIDLAQAEAVSEMITASNEQSLIWASRQLEGRLSEYVTYLRNDLKVMKAQLEAMIDFPEDEDVQGLHYFEVVDRVDRISNQIQKLLSTYKEGRLLREGIRVAIVGKPNVGKSSLFNALLQENRAIVHPTPGTTRDLIEESLDLNGILVRFIDTAGLRQGHEEIESEGIRRTHERLKQSDIVLAVIDGSRPLDKEDELVFESLKSLVIPVFYILNKSDLPSKTSLDFALSISAKQGLGLEELKQKILGYFIKKTSLTSDLVLTNLRHHIALEKGLQVLGRVKQASLEKLSLEFLVADLTVAMNHLGEITGEVTYDEILGEIFSKFCIGK